jgi:HSP20 family molecular chaperone IbpA
VNTEPTKVNGTAHERALHRRTVTPPVDIYENADEILVVADIPGVSPDHVHVFFEDDTLKIEAQRTDLGDVRYERAFRVTSLVDVGGVTAEAKNGTVVVHLPKAAHSKRRRIPIRT